MEQLVLKNLSFTYQLSDRPALSGISLSVRRGDFVLLCGPSGCGKSTLLKSIKPALAPHGERSGDILLDGKSVYSLSLREQSTKIGFVMQSPDEQIVTDKVWHELAFGLESLGLENGVIRRRVAEMASFFGISDWFYKNVSELSGGQKQLLNLASVMAMQPEILILDEPTSQLDPIAASDFLAAVAKINRETGTTVIITEHRLEEVFPVATLVAVLKNGELFERGSTVEIAEKLKNDDIFASFPTAMRVWGALPNDFPCPVTVRDGRQFLSNFKHFRPLLPEKKSSCECNALTAENLCFRYEKDGNDIVKELDFSLKKGEFSAILGSNGAGKSTTLKLLAGLIKPYRGRVCANGKVCLLPQNPQTLFTQNTVRAELFDMFAKDFPENDREKSVSEVVSLCRLEKLLDRHPFDLSGGEMQRAALAKILLMRPDILLLDEPTKGLDYDFKCVFAEIIKTLLRSGVSVLAVSHDIEFCAKYAHRCSLFFDGAIVASETPRRFFSGNSFYTTAANRMARDFLPDAVTPEDIIYSLGGDLPKEPKIESKGFSLPPPPESPDSKVKKLPLWRKIIAFLSAICAAGVFIKALSVSDLRSLVSSAGVSADAKTELITYGIFIIALLIFAFSIAKREEPAPKIKKRLPKRTVFACLLILIFIPLTLFFGAKLLGNGGYYPLCVLVLLECMLPFFLVFEGKKPKARELVTLAALCALGIAGRAAFFMLPQFKPIIALTVIAGVALGGEGGFLVGAVSMLVSNLMFAEGPWAPFQMFATGIIGFLSGILFRKGLLSKSRLALSIFGAVCAVVIYGGIMNPASALIWAQSIDLKMLLGYYLTGFPMDCVHAGATFLFLWFCAKPILEKLERLKEKYGMFED